MNTSRFCCFSDDELYMLKRQALESSYNIVMTKKYDKEQIDMHQKLMNEIIDACRNRRC